MKNAKFPIFLRIPVFNSIENSLVGFSNSFSQKQHRKHFIHLCLSITHQGSTRIKEATQFVSNSSGSVIKNLCHFLQSKAWILELIVLIHTSNLKKNLLEKSYVILDYTALVKTGKNIEYLGKVLDGRDGLIKSGYNMLMSLMVDSNNENSQKILLNDVASNVLS